jgi:DNA-binding transcriptional LysR family regulator
MEQWGATMQDLNDLYYYVQVVDNRGFAAAGRALGVPKSKLSRRVALLERRLGVRLIQRSTRRFAVTEIGQSYYAHCKAMLVEADAAQEAIELTRSEPRGIVRMTCPVALLDARVGAMLAAFMLQYPSVDVHLEATDRRVDVISEAVDVAIRVRTPPLQDSDLVQRSLGDSGQCLVASPALLQRFGMPVTPADLAMLPSMAHGTCATRAQLATAGARRCASLDSSSSALHHSRHDCPAACCARRRRHRATADDDGARRTRARRVGALCCRAGHRGLRSCKWCLPRAAASCRRCARCSSFWRSASKPWMHD